MSRTASVFTEARHTSYRRAVSSPHLRLVWVRSGQVASVQRGRVTTRERGDVFLVKAHESVGLLPIDDGAYRLVVADVAP